MVLLRYGAVKTISPNFNRAFRSRVAEVGGTVPVARPDHEHVPLRDAQLQRRERVPGAQPREEPAQHGVHVCVDLLVQVRRLQARVEPAPATRIGGRLDDGWKDVCG